MRRFKNKNIIILIPLIIFLLIIFFLIFFIYFYNAGNKIGLNNQELTNFNKKINSIVEKDNKYFDPSQFKEAFAKLNNEKLSDLEHYKALEDIAFYFSVAYAASHNPEIRNYVNSIKSFAKNNYPKYYNKEPFNVGCADPVCGEKPDAEFQQIKKEINETGIAFEYLNTINKNLDQAIYIPIEQIEEKKYGFMLVISQLETNDNPKASAAAKRLTDYIKKKYSIKFNDVKIQEPNKL